MMNRLCTMGRLSHSIIPLSRLFKFDQFFVVIFLRNDMNLAAHLIMTKTAKLSAINLIVSKLSWSKPSLNRHPRYCILLYSKVREKKTMNDIFRTEPY